MPKIKSCLVQDGELHDYILHNKCHPVNIRLLSSNIEYYRIINSIVDHMSDAMNLEYSDYTTLLGISGANVGIPFNIVIVRLKELDLVMLNPEIIRTSNSTRVIESNCGSICLDKPIDVERYTAVTVRYIPFDVPLNEFKLDSPSQFSPAERVFRTGTVQHEIDHNNGILITDKEKP